MKILIINGPNLNLLGKREPEIYGSKSFEQYLPELKAKFDHDSITYFQSNHEGAIIDQLQQASESFEGIILNAASYSHTSIGIADAIAASDLPVVEVHISNIHQREEFRKHSFLSANCIGTITGFGLKSYELGIRALIEK